MNILAILNELAANNSRLAKEEILNREKQNELLKHVFEAALNPFVQYYIKKIPEYREAHTKISLAQAINELCVFTTRKYTGNAAIEYLSNLLARLSPDNAVVLERIISRDLRCGVQESTVNKIWPGLIPTFDVMLAHKDISGIKYPCYGQIKFDGARCHLHWDGVKVSAFARSGKEFELRGKFDAEFKKNEIPGGLTLDGELLVVRNGNILDRKTGNGILNKASKGTISEAEADEIVMLVWDLVDFEGKSPYKDRLKKLNEFNKVGFTKIKVAETFVINDESEAQSFFERCLTDGHEGAMMKNTDQVWEPKRVKGIGKMKAEEVADLIIVDYEEGSGKYVGMLGNIICETSDGLLRVSVGSGFTDQERKDLWKNRTALKKQIVEVKYNQLITSKGKEKAALFLPRFMGFRFDKKVANKMSELK